MRHFGRTALALPALALLLGAVAACNRSAADPGIATANGAQPKASASAAAAGADIQKFAQCMRDNGIDMPDPDPNTGRPQFGGAANGNREAFQKAMQACRTLLPNGGTRPQLDQAQIEQLRVFAQCMRDNGVDMPDPDPNGGGFGLGLGGGGQNPQLDRNNPTFQKAFEACQSKLPQFRGGGPGASRPGGAGGAGGSNS
jgi:hypothetical protein